MILCSKCWQLCVNVKFFPCVLCRFLVVFLSLISLQYVAVSFTETVKSSAPLFTVLISWLVLREQNGLYVQLSLLPIMIGLMLCSVYELSFTMTGFLAALGTNIAEWSVPSENLIFSFVIDDACFFLTTMVAV